MRLTAKGVRILCAKFHCNRLLDAEDTEDTEVCTMDHFSGTLCRIPRRGWNSAASKIVVPELKSTKTWPPNSSQAYLPVTTQTEKLFEITMFT